MLAQTQKRAEEEWIAENERKERESREAAEREVREAKEAKELAAAKAARKAAKKGKKRALATEVESGAEEVADERPKPKK
jgi:hypothetical protein